MHVHLSPEVREAIEEQRPVVALESTILAHGMPFPQNRTVGAELERAVRANGAVPATIAVFDGVCYAGLTEAQLDRLAEEGASWLKLSSRDLAFAVSRRVCGATTVAATLVLAHRAGIRVFATGGIGGVHRGAFETGDVSADLPALATTPVAVVSAGAKAILDLPATLEYLETLGVPVVGLGTEDFPAFYSRSSGYKVPWNLPDEKSVAAFLHAHWHLGLRSGVLVANPIPREAEIPADQIEPFIRMALEEAATRRISGKALTPFLLARLHEVTGGRSQAANTSLALHNAAAGARIAVELEKTTVGG